MVRKADALVVLPQSGDAVVELNARVSAAQFTYLERVRVLLVDIQALAVAIGSQEYVIFHLGIDGLREP